VRAFLSHRAVLACALPVVLVAGSVSVPSAQNHSLPLALKDARPPAAAQHRRVLEQYAQLPLYFEPNLGQTAAPVQFLARTGGYTLFLTPGEAVMVLSRGQSHGQQPLHRHQPPQNSERAVVRMKLEGAAATAPVAGLERQPGIGAYHPPVELRPRQRMHASLTGDQLRLVDRSRNPAWRCRRICKRLAQTNRAHPAQEEQPRANCANSN